MTKSFDRSGIPLSFIGLSVLATVLLYLLPPERTLGDTIKIVFLHGAVAQTGLVAFGMAGLLGIVSFAWSRKPLGPWCLATQKAAVVVWVVYVLTSIMAAYFAWEVAISWEEPRMRAGIRVLGMCIIFLVLVMWIKDNRFTSMVNVVLAALAWFMIKNAAYLRHPVDPVGSSDEVVMKGLFWAIFSVVLLMSVQLTRWFYKETV